jgi:hypothetical protein
MVDLTGLREGQICTILNFQVRLLMHTDAASTFPAELTKSIEEGGYCAQVFNIDETALFCKKMPTRMFLATRKLSKDISRQRTDSPYCLVELHQETKLKPLLVYSSENPRAFKGKVNTLLPVIWRSNSKALVTADLCQDSFSNSFVPAVEATLLKSYLSFKLLLDNAAGHPQSGYLFPEVKVVFLPPDTTSAYGSNSYCNLQALLYMPHNDPGNCCKTVELYQSLENSG